MPEEWGDTQFVNVSAKTGDGMHASRSCHSSIRSA